MKIQHSRFGVAMVVVAATISLVTPSSAQVAGGTTTVDTSITESTQVAMGWSVKKSLMGKTVYNDAGEKVGKVDDLIISPDKNVSYVIVGAGGFLGMGRHDVAIQVAQIQQKAGKLVMAGATKDMIKSMPAFTYASDITRRDQFVAAADKDIALGKSKVSDLQKKAGTVAAEARADITVQINTLQLDVRSAEVKLAEMKRATASRWQDFEAGVSAATTRLRKSIEAAVG